MALTRMIFGIQTTAAPTRLRVSGKVGTPAPVMTSLHREGTPPSSVGCVDGAWTMDLDAGDHLVEIQVEQWLAGRLDITTEPPPGHRSPIFVYFGPLPEGSPQDGLAAWETAALRIDPPETSIVDDPKDPWPPPPPPPPRVALAPASAAWFTAALAAARARIASQRDGGGKGPPPGLFDALVNER